MESKHIEAVLLLRLKFRRSSAIRRELSNRRKRARNAIKGIEIHWLYHRANWIWWRSLRQRCQLSSAGVGSTTGGDQRWQRRRRGAGDTGDAGDAAASGGIGRWGRGEARGGQGSSNRCPSASVGVEPATVHSRRPASESLGCGTGVHLLLALLLVSTPDRCTTDSSV